MYTLIKLFFCKFNWSPLLCVPSCHLAEVPVHPVECLMPINTLFLDWGGGGGGGGGGSCFHLSVGDSSEFP